MVSVSSCLVPFAPVAPPLNRGDHALLLPESERTQDKHYIHCSILGTFSSRSLLWNVPLNVPLKRTELTSSCCVLQSTTVTIKRKYRACSFLRFNYLSLTSSTTDMFKFKHEQQVVLSVTTDPRLSKTAFQIMLCYCRSCPHFENVGIYCTSSYNYCSKLTYSH